MQTAELATRTGLGGKISRRVRNIAWMLLLCPLSVMANPVIMYTDISSGPNSGGEKNLGAYLSIFGKGFGDNVANIKVIVGEGEVARYLFLGKSFGRQDVQQLSVQLGSAVTSGSIKVVVNGRSSNTDHVFTVRPGNFFYISDGGKDRRGRMNDISRPYRTPNYVANSIRKLKAGDFIVVRGGKYDLRKSENNIRADSWLRAEKSGNKKAPIVFIGYPGEKVEVIHGKNVLLFSNYVSISDWVVGNFHVTLTDCAGPGEVIYVGTTTTPELCKDTSNRFPGKASRIKIVNMEVDGKDKAGFCSGGDGLVEIGYSEGVKVIGLSLHNTSPKKGDQESAHAIYLSARQSGTEIAWNDVYNIPATRAVIQVHQDSFWGSCWGKKFITDVKIHGNVLRNLAGQAILLDGGTGDISIFNNVIHDHKDHRYEDIIALRSGGGRLNAKIYNNTIYANANSANKGWLIGIGFGGNIPDKVTLYNNIIHAVDAQDAYIGTDASWQLLNRWIRNGNLVSDHNIWFGSRERLPAFDGRNSISRNPMFRSSEKKDFHLLPKSPGNRKGTSRVKDVVKTDHDGMKRKLSNRYDIGAFRAPD